MHFMEQDMPYWNEHISIPLSIEHQLSQPFRFRRLSFISANRSHIQYIDADTPTSHTLFPDRCSIRL